MSKTIFDLELHETLMVTTNIPLKDGGFKERRLYVTRVSGGWLYKRALEDDPTVFVPYNEELKPSKYSEPHEEIYI